MKKFKWGISIEAPEGEKELSEKELKASFCNIIDGACDTTYKDGMNRQMMRKVFKISDKIEKAKGEFVELEDAEFGVLDEIFDKGKFRSVAKKVLVQIYDNLDVAREKKGE